MKFDAMLVFGAIMQYSEEKCRWLFPEIIPSYLGRLVLGDWRARAASVLSPQTKLILVSGGVDLNPKTQKKDSRAVELAKLIESYGVPQDMLRAIGKPENGNVRGNILNLLEYVHNNPEVKKVGMLCPRFQMERAKLVLYSELGGFTHPTVDFTWIEVENTLIDADPSFRTNVNSVYSSEHAAVCYKMEKNGIRDLLSGQYKN